MAKFDSEKVTSLEFIARLGFAQLAIGAILGKKFANIPAHDLVTGRA